MLGLLYLSSSGGSSRHRVGSGSFLIKYTASHSDTHRDAPAHTDTHTQTHTDTHTQTHRLTQHYTLSDVLHTAPPALSHCWPLIYDGWNGREEMQKILLWGGEFEYCVDIE